MTGNKAISKLLKLKGLLLTNVEFKFREKAVYLFVKPHKNGCLCPECERRGKIKRIMPEARTWRDVCVCGWTIFFVYRPKEIECPTHGRKQEKIPWADAFARVTYRLEFLILSYSKLMTQKAAAELLHMPTSTFSDILHRTIKRTRDGHRIRGVKCIGIDEVSYKKRHKYVTVVYDLERSCVLWVGQGKKRETIDTFFKDELSDYQKKQIRWACCDMSETFIGAIKQHCPNAKLVLDRFHIAKALNEAMDEVRKEQWRSVSGDERKVLKGVRWILFKNYADRSEEDKEILNTLRKSNRRIHRAGVLKDEFEQFWTYKAPWAARRFLKRWTTAALKSRVEPLRKFVKTIRKHAEDIITFVEARITNAVAEGLNRVIRLIKNRASGFSNVQAFIDLIYLTIGDVDIPARFPTRFRTL
jgi:transposase